MKRLTAILLLSLFSGLGYAQLPTQLTIQEAVYPVLPNCTGHDCGNSGYVPGVTRTGYPVSAGIPLADSENIQSVSQLGLIGASAGQFRALAKWPSGNLKWVLVNTQADITANSTNTMVSVCKIGQSGCTGLGSGTMATDNGSTITVNTGPAIFTLRKANFNFFDNVIVNGRTLISSDTGTGLVVMGPAFPATSCGTCTIPYTSRNDPGSTASIEEQGPVRVVVKANGALRDASGNLYMRYTVRLHFFRDQQFAKAEVSLQNADEGGSNSFASAYKGFTSYELRLSPAIGGSRSATFGNHTPSPTSVRFSGNENAYLYSAYSTKMEENIDYCDWTDPRVVSYIARSGSSPSSCNDTFSYAQNGYQIVDGGSVVQSGSQTQYPDGWADLSDSSGAGIEVGFNQMAAYWPKSLQFMSGGSEIRLGIWPDQNLFAGGGGIPYYQSWPQHTIQTVFFNFHATPLSSASAEFFKFQEYPLARAPIAQYNKARVFPYPILDPGQEDSYYKSLPGLTCCKTDNTPAVVRFKAWNMGGGGNQMEFRYGDLMFWLQRGFTGQYLFTSNFYNYEAEAAFPRSDYAAPGTGCGSVQTFDWRCHTPTSDVNALGFPDNVISANSSLAHRKWIDNDHAHWWGIMFLYLMSGNEFLKDSIYDGPADFYLNTSPLTQGSGLVGLVNTRQVGEFVGTEAMLHDLFQSFGDANSAATAYAAADNVLANNVYPQLQVSGFGNSPLGTSPVRGMHWGRNEGADNCPGAGSPSYTRVSKAFMHGIYVDGLWQYLASRGPNWPGYSKLFDAAYGAANWSLQETFTTVTGAPLQSGFTYCIGIDNATTLKPTPLDTVWANFYLIDQYTHDLNKWRPQFEAAYVRGCPKASIAGGCSDWGQPVVQAVIDRILNPGNSSVQDLSPPALSVQNLGGGAYQLSWTAPMGVTSYRVKDLGTVQAKSIVNWVSFNPVTNTFIGDPNSTWPWFSSTEVTSSPNSTCPPAPQSAGSTQTCMIRGLDTTLNWQFAVKVLISGSSSSGDNTPPTVSLISPAQGSTVSGKLVVSANSSDDHGVSSVIFRVDGTAVGTAISVPYSVNWDTTKAANGPHTISAISTDLAGNTAVASAAIVVNNSADTTPPSVSLTSPGDASTVSSTILVKASASDNMGLSSVAFRVDGSQIGTATSSPYLATWNTTNSKNGAHILMVVATDLAGNTATSSVTVTVNNSNSAPPNVSIVAPTQGATVSGSIVLNAVVSAASGIRSVIFRVDATQIGVLVSSPFSVTWDSGKAVNGPHTVTVVATDTAGNTGSDTVNVQLNNHQQTQSELEAISPVAVDAQTQFGVDVQDLGVLIGCAQCAFQSAADMIAGQSLEIQLRSSPSSMADRVVLKQGAVNGTVVSVSGHQFVISTPAGSPWPQSLVVVTGDVTNLSEEVHAGQQVQVRGLLFKSGAIGSPNIVARTVRVQH